MNRLVRIVLAIVGLLVLLVVIVGVVLVIMVRRPFPQRSGTIVIDTADGCAADESVTALCQQLQLHGLQEEVHIYRDEYGVPHIYAQNQEDLFFAQGYVHAQDRFWQMEFWRHVGAGRISEIAGEAT